MTLKFKGTSLGKKMNQPTSGPGAFIGERCLATDSNSPGKV
jgi:hypothetical protein